MLSKDKRAEINRRNAMKSTGPKTKEGKKTASYNALRHGCTGQIVVMPEEDMQAYLKFQQTYHDLYKPANAIEVQFVQIIVDASWKMNRCSAWQELLNAQQSKLRDSDHSAENDPQINTAMAMAAAMAEMSRVITNFSMYEQRQYRMLDSAVKRLESLQEQRRKQHAADLDEAELLMNLHDHEQKQHTEQSRDREGAESTTTAMLTPYDPSTDGFVFQVADIKAHTRRQDRLARAYQLLEDAGEAA